MLYLLQKLGKGDKHATKVRVLFFIQIIEVVDMQIEEYDIT